MHDKTQIDLLRHGETRLNEVSKDSVFLGSTDTSLSLHGWQQMKSAINNNDYQRIISSPLKRCLDFSQYFSKENEISIMIENDLREIDFGDWEVEPIKELWQTQEVLLSAFWDDPRNNTPPNAEKLTVFQTRVNMALNNIINKYKGEKILMVVHGGVIRQIISNVLSIEFKTAQQISIDYGSLSRLNCYDKNINLAFINQRIKK